MTDRILLLVGTKKGAFIVESDTARKTWAVRGPTCDGWPIQDISYDPASGAMFAGGGSPWYGPTVFRSDDLGATWSHVEGLTNHPTRPTWEPGAGGLILHTIVPHPTDRDRMWIAISAVGTFETRDGGLSWEPRNHGVRADFQPDPMPETGQCVHKLVAAAGEPEHLYQQNHCGVYRSFDGGATWQEITAGLPSEFGFGMVAHPRDPLTVWNIPLNGADKGRFMPDGSAAVWRTHDGGDTWIRGEDGLPQHDAYLGVLREAMARDELDPVGVYFGTSTGQLFASADGGSSWDAISTTFPPIWSVEAVRIPA